MMKAALKDDAAAIKRLLNDNDGALIDLTTPKGKTALFLAARLEGPLLYIPETIP